MKTFYFNITEKMYDDIFKKVMPASFFEGLRFIGGNSFCIEFKNPLRIAGNKGKDELFYEAEDSVISVLERYGCAWQEDEDYIVD